MSNAFGAVVILKKVENSAFQVVNNESYDKLGSVVETCALVDGGRRQHMCIYVHA
jgi:hypothetical protein